MSLSCYNQATYLLNATTHFKPFDEIAVPLCRIRITSADINRPIKFFTPQEIKKPFKPGLALTLRKKKMSTINNKHFPCQ